MFSQKRKRRVQRAASLPPLCFTPLTVAARRGYIIEHPADLVRHLDWYARCQKRKQPLIGLELRAPLSWVYYDLSPSGGCLSSAFAHALSSTFEASGSPSYLVRGEHGFCYIPPKLGEALASAVAAILALAEAAQSKEARDDG